MRLRETLANARAGLPVALSRDPLVDRSRLPAGWNMADHQLAPDPSYVNDYELTFSGSGAFCRHVHITLEGGAWVITVEEERTGSTDGWDRVGRFEDAVQRAIDAMKAHPPRITYQEALDEPGQREGTAIAPIE